MKAYPENSLLPSRLTARRRHGPAHGHRYGGARSCWAASFVMCSLLHAPTLDGQTLTGTILGVVREDSGAVLLGVTATISSTAMPGGPVSVITTDQGPVPVSGPRVGSPCRNSALAIPRRPTIRERAQSSDMCSSPGPTVQLDELSLRVLERLGIDIGDPTRYAAAASISPGVVSRLLLLTVVRVAATMRHPIAPSSGHFRDWPDLFPLPRHRETGRWRHGRGLQGQGHSARPLCRAQVLASRYGPGSTGSREIPPRGQGRFPPESS